VISSLKVLKQCKTCPWKASADVDKIPNYRRALHEKLTCTIADGPSLPTGPLRMMSCHYSTESSNIPCAGWLHHQIGPGNNIGARLAVMTGAYPPPKVTGRQHPTFEATLRPLRRARTRSKAR